MKIGIILNSNEPETVWNTFRFGVTALFADHNVKIFVTGKGVEYGDIKDKKFDVQKQIEYFVENKGEILACGTCLDMRNKRDSDICPMSTIQDMLKLVEESDKVLVFG